MATKFKFSIVTPNGTYFDGEVEEIIVGGITGTLGILNNHMETIVPLKPFETRYVIDGNSTSVSTSTGVLKVEKGNVVMAVESCEAKENKTSV
ncbi:ATPase [Clostridium cellulovorans]|uniref:ATPase, F1 complex, delta/epsilon subunit-like n=1 Tax=Clostridium cellulovorans (strain ATCC 35296 / DSM 3052 / OCM 3 / 743B) TaxID=573061 RepID=D9STK4_CLOC7|nr:ATPase [Clostridium cellulovorans]ADL52738.1 ATPase, F1 complex, delta/epsilon subunit-like [Clostridium cellulovorans 743B]